MDIQALLARLTEQREHWVDLPDAGKRLRFLRPEEVDLPKFARGVKLEHVIEYANGWSGFTEADLFGASIGSSTTAVEFHRDIWAAVVRDRARYLPAVSAAMVEVATAYLKSRGETAKKSLPSSTQPAASSSRATKRKAS